MVDRIVYGLIDPRTLLIRYVGKSSRGLKRIRQHLNSWNLKKTTHKTNWLNQLLNLNLEPNFVILETSDHEEALCASEIWWIAYGKACGWPLTNSTDGGEGAPGRILTDEVKEKIRVSNLGLKRSPESKKKMSKAAKARDPDSFEGVRRYATKKCSDPTVPAGLANIHWDKEGSREERSEEMKAKWADPEYARMQSDAHKGRITPEETKVKQRASAPKGNDNPAKKPENRAKISEGLRQAWARRKAEKDVDK